MLFLARFCAFDATFRFFLHHQNSNLHSLYSVSIDTVINSFILRMKAHQYITQEETQHTAHNHITSSASSKQSQPDKDEPSTKCNEERTTDGLTKLSYDNTELVANCQSLESVNQEQPISPTCPICTEDLHKEPSTTTSCQHEFHTGCLETWLSTPTENGSTHQTCPMCRTVIAESNPPHSIEETFIPIISGEFLFDILDENASLSLMHCDATQLLFALTFGDDWLDEFARYSDEFSDMERSNL
jgi:hypothetical protein